MHPIKLTFKVVSSGLIGPPLSLLEGNKLPFSLIPAFAKTISIRPCWLYIFSNTAAWLSQEDTSHSSNDTPAFGNSERSLSNASVPDVGLMSKIVIWVFSSVIKCFVTPSPIPEAPPNSKRNQHCHYSDHSDMLLFLVLFSYL